MDMSSNQKFLIDADRRLSLVVTIELSSKLCFDEGLLMQDKVEHQLAAEVGQH